ncbi:HAD family hydrolase [Hoeflea poritis]|uniref:HAD family hydrolase n=1 Tax=Hoeflea poritis TaxID=2993659 RepID=A0ABT4VKL1_9HYPH|nr:HAD family hydrolase [Hoeflea poritis]MDA4845253.1 HAD family hydrolase [Hoeflea poritis]
MNMGSRKHVVLADIDNTLYDWGRFFAPSFRAMCHALSRELNLPFDDLVSDFRSVYSHHDSLEYAFSIQELNSVKRLSSREVENLVRIGRGAFSKVQKFHLKPYPGVQEGLEFIHKHGHLLFCVTNSPLYLAQKRLFELRLDKYVSGIVAWEGIGPSEAVNVKYVSGSKRKRTRIELVATFHKSESKPNPYPYTLALDMLPKDVGQIWAIGDSRNKDLSPASSLGIQTIWAKYGAVFDPQTKDNQTLLQITNWSNEEVAHTYDHQSFQPDFQVESFSEVSQLLPKRNLTLLDLMEDSIE